MDANDIQSCKSKCNMCGGISACAENWGKEGGSCSSDSDCSASGSGLVCGINKRCEKSDDPTVGAVNCQFDEILCRNVVPSQCFKGNCCLSTDCDIGSGKKCENHVCVPV